MQNEGNRRGGSGGSPVHLFRGKYAPESFLIPGQDQNGNSIRLWCRVIPLLDRAIDILVSSKKFPFRTKGDLLRFCIDRQVAHLNEMEPVTGSVLVQADAMISILRAEMHNHSFMTVFDNMAATVTMYIQTQALGEARRVLSMMQHCIDEMDEGYWKNRYTMELDKRFGYLMKGELVAGAGLGDHKDHGPDRSIEDLEESEMD